MRYTNGLVYFTLLYIQIHAIRQLVDAVKTNVENTAVNYSSFGSTC